MDTEAFGKAHRVGNKVCFGGVAPEDGEETVAYYGCQVSKARRDLR